jgi:hypothetical protein
VIVPYHSFVEFIFQRFRTIINAIFISLDHWTIRLRELTKFMNRFEKSKYLLGIRVEIQAHDGEKVRSQEIAIDRFYLKLFFFDFSRMLFFYFRVW